MRDQSVAPYLVEEVRKHLERTYGAKRLYESGLTVRTSIDLVLQRAANRALADGLRRIDKRHAASAGPRGTSSTRAWLPRPSRTRAGSVRWPSVTSCRRWSSRWPANAARAAAPLRPRGRLPPGGARLRVGGSLPISRATGSPGRAADRRPRSCARAIWSRSGSSRLDEAKGTASVALEQEPELDGAVLAIDNRTGQVLAMVGGYDFERSKFNRAVQAYRQMGSVFKPIVYTAAIDRGFTPATDPRGRPGRRTPPDPVSRRTRRTTTTTASRAPSRCGAPSSSRATCRPSG